MSLREVGVGKPYSTIQAALDNLYTTVGSAVFIETHTIRVFDGTYTETPTPHTNLNPTATYRLMLESASGNNPIIDGQSIRFNGIYISAIDYVTVNGFTLKSNTGNGIYFYSISRYGIVFNNICYSNIDGIFFQGSDGQNPIYSNIYNNICYSNSGNGIYITSGANATVYKNTFYNNATNGIYIYSSANSIIYGNKCYSNNGSGISIFNNPTSIVYNNISYLNNVNGIWLRGNNNTVIYNNTCCFNNATGIYLYADNPNCTIKNNIIWAMGGSTKYCIQIYSSSQTGCISNYNDFYVTNFANVGVWGTTIYATLSAWQTASGQDANSISANPKFRSLDAELIIDLTIIDSSPCKGIGENLSAIFTTDFNGIIRTIPWDLGAYIYTAIYSPIITNQQLSNYAPTQDQIIDATCNIVGMPDNVIVHMNGKSFIMTLVSGTLYKAIIPVYKIGECTAKTIYFMATNYWGGSDEIAPSTITISAMANYDIAAIETQIVLILSGITQIKTVLDYEPKIIPQLPAVTLFYDGYTQTQTEAVSYTVTHKWIMRLYVRLDDAEKAQDDLKLITKLILQKFKQYLDLSGVVMFSSTPSATVGAILDKNNPVIIVSFDIEATKEEV